MRGTRNHITLVWQIAKNAARFEVSMEQLHSWLRP